MGRLVVLAVKLMGCEDGAVDSSRLITVMAELVPADAARPSATVRMICHVREPGAVTG